MGVTQHAVADIPAFLAAYREQNVPVIIGNRMAHPRSMPLIRKLTNRFMSWLLSREMGQRGLEYYQHHLGRERSVASLVALIESVA